MSFTRAQWAPLRANTPLLLGEDELEKLRGVNEPMPVHEVAEIFLPLSRLVNLHVTAARRLLQVTDTFLMRPSLSPPFILGVAGSVAVGKSTIARVMRALLARWPEHPRVELVTTDGFLLPNAELEARGLMRRKGFPESYDVGRLLRFLADVKSGQETVQAPVYSHLTYDVVRDETVTVHRPDILIVEGINVLQGPEATRDGDGVGRPRVVVSDFFDFSIYVDADEDALERWYVNRFLTFRDTAFRDPESYFHRYSQLSQPEAIDTARGIWREINLVNLQQNIVGTRERATVILRKDAHHAVEEVRLRRTDPTPPVELR
ncbi:Pantothenate kinase [Gemmatirosa kalamazoonensis]|uniref:Pantothenate kinase n=2 Tax=Gemmatirosa kalamazoonensis TaxID=861299 RepID=W0RQG0_9BACT|nr:Pantothenate kinase [Gemmatirosa kalamazoonensis]